MSWPLPSHIMCNCIALARQDNAGLVVLQSWIVCNDFPCVRQLEALLRYRLYIASWSEQT